MHPEGKRNGRIESMSTCCIWWLDWEEKMNENENACASAVNWCIWKFQLIMLQYVFKLSLSEDIMSKHWSVRVFSFFFFSFQFRHKKKSKIAVLTMVGEIHCWRARAFSLRKAFCQVVWSLTRKKKLKKKSEKEKSSWVTLRMHRSIETHMKVHRWHWFSQTLMFAFICH